MTLKLPQQCIDCPLFSWDKNFTLNEGDGSSGLLVVAEAPGEWEAEEGRPLSPNGRSGKVFRRALRELGIPAHRLTITNILRSRPPDNELRGQPYEREAIDHCSQYLKRTIAEAQPKAILALGDVPQRELELVRQGTNTAMRGFVRESKYGPPLISTYHPSYIARGMWSLYGAFKADIKFALQVALHGPPQQLETNYVLNPGPADVRDFLERLRGDVLSPMSYDVETPGIIGEPEPADWRQKRIIQIQFSITPGHAIVFPWTDDFIPAAKVALGSPNPKFGHNSRLSDDLALQAVGIEINGILHDTLNAFGHLQPSFWGGKEEHDPDNKDVPSRLMGLESVASFYCPEIGPYKGMVQRAMAATGGQVTEEVTQTLHLYGAIDADVGRRVGVGILNSIERAGLAEGYRSHKLDLRPVLDDLGEIGLPVDRTAQLELREYVQTELQAIQARIQQQVPLEVLGIHPKSGYKMLHNKVSVFEAGKDPDQWPKIALRAIAEDYDPSNPPLVMAAGHTGYLVQRDFASTNGGATERRWCIERLYNPHGSSPNTRSYIRAKGYRMPTKIDDPSKDTTGKLELQRLADETGDEVLRLTGDWREMFKTGMDYTSDKWVPGDDGRVHATFRFGTASAQTTAINPPVQTYPEHSGIAKRAKAAIRAQEGYTLVKVDARGFHARMAGWLAKDPDYYRLADFDVHSFLTGHFLHLHDAPYYLDMDDDELSAALAQVKSEHGHVRNYKVKRVVHGVTFGMKARKLYRMYSQNFENEREAQGLIDLLQELFPRTFVVFPQWVERQIREVTPCRLVSPFKHHRFFWDYDLEQAIAYLPSNASHCHIQAALVRLRRAGTLARFQFCNFTHDAGWFHCRTEEVADCVAAIKLEFERESDVLVDSPVGPFFCRADAETGPSLAEMRPWVRS